MRKREGNSKLNIFSSPFSDLYIDLSSKWTTYSESAPNFTSDRGEKRGKGGRKREKFQKSKLAP